MIAAVGLAATTDAGTATCSAEKASPSLPFVVKRDLRGVHPYSRNLASDGHAVTEKRLGTDREPTTALINDKTMDINEEQRRQQWDEAVARMAAQLDDFKGRIDSESQLLCAKLSAEIALLQSDLKHLELEALGAGSDAYARRIAKLVEQLRAQGEATYELLQATLPADMDSTSVEIRRLEALATDMTGDARAALITRIEELRAARATAPSHQQTEPNGKQPSERRYSPHG